MKYKKLDKAPLKEVIFEAFWDLPTDETGFPNDPEFDKDLESFKELTKEIDFTVHKEIGPKSIVKVFPSVMHQFWKSELMWPVIQLGLGMFTVNDVGSTYVWDDTYYPSIVASLNALTNSRSNELKFNKATLKYINSIDIEDDGYEAFFADNFNVQITNNYKIKGKFKGFQISEGYELKDGSVLSFTIQTVKNNLNNKSAIVFYIGAEKTSDLTLSNIITWLQFAHEQISDLFVDIINEKLYASFN